MIGCGHVAAMVLHQYWIVNALPRWCGAFAGSRTCDCAGVPQMLGCEHAATLVSHHCWVAQQPLELGKSGQDWAGLCKTRQDWASVGKIGQDWAEQSVSDRYWIAITLVRWCRTDAALRLRWCGSTAPMPGCDHV